MFGPFLSSIMNLLRLFLLSGSALISSACGPARGPSRRRGPRKILPLIYKQHEPNFSERSLAASGLPDGEISRRDERFRDLVPNYNPDIIFKDEEGTGADRIMTQRCKEKLNTLAISVMNQWPGLRLRVTEGWDEEAHHARQSLHYEGRAVDITTSDRDRSKYGLLASLAVEAGFDWVYYESRSHVHASCRAESSSSDSHTGCFTGTGKVVTELQGRKNMSELRPGERVQAVDGEGRLVFSEVLFFLDRQPSRAMQFVSVRVAGGSVVSLTATHLVYTAPPGCSQRDCFSPSYAGLVVPGQLLLVGENVLAARPVESVEVVRQTGVFAPLTAAGNIMVDGVLASCYAVIDSQTIAHTAFAPVRWYYSLASWVSPDRAGAAEPRSSQAEGVHWYAGLLYRLGSRLLPAHLQL